MENAEEIVTSGRVTRSLRKRLTSVDSSEPSSRPGTPSKLVPIPEKTVAAAATATATSVADSPARSTRMTRRNSFTGLAATPIKTPSKSRTTVRSEVSDMNSPARRSTRKQSLTLIEEINTESVKTKLETLSETRASTEEHNEEESSECSSGNKTRTRLQKRGPKSKVHNRSLSATDSDVEVINLDINNDSEKDEEQENMEKKDLEGRQTSKKKGNGNDKNENSAEKSKTIEGEKMNAVTVLDETVSSLKNKNEEGEAEGEGDINHKQSPIGQEGKNNKENTAKTKTVPTIPQSTVTNLKSPLNGRSPILIKSVVHLENLTPQKIAKLTNTSMSSPSNNRSITSKSVAFDNFEDERNKSVYPKTPALAKSKSYIEMDSEEKSSQSDTSFVGSNNDVETEKQSTKKRTDSGNLIHVDAKTPHKLKVLGDGNCSTPISLQNEEIQNSREVQHVNETNGTNKDDLLSPEKYLRSGKKYGDSPSPSSKGSPKKSPTNTSKMNKSEMESIEEKIEDSETTSRSEMDDNRVSSTVETSTTPKKVEEKLSFAKSWSQNVVVLTTSDTKIDPITSINFTEIAKDDNEMEREKEKKALIVSKSDIVIDERSTDGENNEYIDDEAIEAPNNYESGDSMDEEERLEMEENAIPSDGKSIGSEDTSVETLSEEEESDSFIASDDSNQDYLLEYSDDDEHLSGISNASGKNENKNKFKRIKNPLNDSDSEDENEMNEEKMKDDEKSNDSSSQQKPLVLEVSKMIDESIAEEKECDVELKKEKRRISTITVEESPLGKQVDESLKQSQEVVEFVDIEEEELENSRKDQNGTMKEPKGSSGKKSQRICIKSTLNKAENSVVEDNKNSEIGETSNGKEDLEENDAVSQEISVDKAKTKTKTMRVNLSLEEKQQNAGPLKKRKHKSLGSVDVLHYQEENGNDMNDYSKIAKGKKKKESSRLVQLHRSFEMRKKSSAEDDSSSDDEGLEQQPKNEANKSFKSSTESTTKKKRKSEAIDTSSDEEFDAQGKRFRPICQSIEWQKAEMYESSEDDNEFVEEAFSGVEGEGECKGKSEVKGEGEGESNAEVEGDKTTTDEEEESDKLQEIPCSSLSENVSNKKSDSIDTSSNDSASNKDDNMNVDEVEKGNGDCYQDEHSEAEGIGKDAESDSSEAENVTDNKKNTSKQNTLKNVSNTSTSEESSNENKSEYTHHTKNCNVGLSVSLKVIKEKDTHSKDGKKMHTSFSYGVSVSRPSIDAELCEINLLSKKKRARKSENPEEGDAATTLTSKSSTPSTSSEMPTIEKNDSLSSDDVGKLKELEEVEKIGDLKIQVTRRQSMTLSRPALNNTSHSSKRKSSAHLSGPAELSESFIESIEEHKRELQIKRNKPKHSKSFSSSSEPTTRAIEHQTEKVMDMSLEPSEFNTKEKTETMLRSSTPHAKKVVGNETLERILGRCDEILETANRAKLEQKLNYVKSKVKLPKKMRKNKKGNDKFKDKNDSMHIPIIKKQDFKRKQKTKLAVEQALKASANIILKDIVNSERSAPTLESSKQSLDLESKRLPQEFLETITANTQHLKHNKSKGKSREVDSVNVSRDVNKMKTASGDVIQSMLTPHKKKKCKINKFEHATGTVCEEPITPKRARINATFRESPITPQNIGHKVRCALTAGQDTPPTSSMSLHKAKKRKREIPEPKHTLPKPKWTQSNICGEDEFPTAHTISRIGATDFFVSNLNSNDRNKKKSNKMKKMTKRPLATAVDNALHFKNTAFLRTNVSRETSKEMIQRKERGLVHSAY